MDSIEISRILENSPKDCSIEDKDLLCQALSSIPRQRINNYVYKLQKRPHNIHFSQADLLTGNEENKAGSFFTIVYEEKEESNKYLTVYVRSDEDGAQITKSSESKICEIVGIDPSQMELLYVSSKSVAVPVIGAGESLKKITQIESKTPGLYLIGTFMIKDDIPECVLRARDLVIKRIS